MMKKGDLLRNKLTGELATVIKEPWVKLFRDSSDWEACHAGFDSGTAATAIRILWHKNGYEKTYMQTKLLRTFEVLKDSNCEGR